MRNFRTYKNKIISSKRDSQKIDQLELLNFSQVYSLSHFNQAIFSLLSQQLHSITEHSYKIDHRAPQQPHNHPKHQSNDHCVQKANTSEQKHINNDERESKLSKRRQKVGRADLLDEQFASVKSTQKKDIENVEKDTLSKILQLMSTLNVLQQKKSSENSLQNLSISTQMKEKLSEFKQLLSSIQSKSQSFDFYNEPNEENHSPNSFNSRSSDEAYQQNTERQAYELAGDQEREHHNQQDLEIRYKRIDLSSSHLQDQNDTFFDQEDDEELFKSSEKRETEDYDRSVSDNSIVHLYSYEKQKCMETPLSAITERQSEYCSPDSKKQSEKEIVSEENLQYKKIRYLLQTSEKKRDISTATNRHEVSEFTIDNKSARSNQKKMLCSDRQRNRSHTQLLDMINLLENKYNRKIKSGSQNIMDALNATLSSKYIRPRQKK